MSFNFPETKFREPLVALLKAINTKIGQPGYMINFTSDLVENDLIKLAEQLASGQYRPNQWFSVKETKGSEFLHIQENMPVLVHDTIYHLLCLPGTDEFSRFTSGADGGIVFEDPFYALLACFNVGNWKKLYILPSVTDHENPWQQRQMIVNSLKEDTYQPSQYFTECLPSDWKTRENLLKILQITGSQLERMREVGMDTIFLEPKEGIATYRLYHFKPPSDYNKPA
ncbi:hypothetical protein PN36_29075 [Candidatus Thiomargarita nelsonii]|uniref:Uncharacterized protein n=1 Tax=Candidatus Thiomargarita nelsonii TaxID=1003181 RepID=A0A0A6P3T5_9GAMM|nr:hypothetical protein PN36_29075 [Candidatus Thiomargarita nelsonii]